MSPTLVHRRSMLVCSAILALTCVPCASESAVSPMGGGAGGGAPGDGTMSQVDAGPDPADASDASAGSDASSCGCGGSTPVCDHGACRTCTSTAGCGADAPVCDTAANDGMGECKKVEVIAFYTPDEQMNDRAHAGFVRHANTWFPQTAAAEGFFTYESTTDWGRLESIEPAAGRIVMFLDNIPWGDAQQTGFRSYAEGGGAYIGFHVSAYNDDGSPWRWFFDDFLGCGRFFNNTWGPTSATLRVEDAAHPVTEGFESSFVSAPSEWYSWAVDLRTKSNIEVLLSVDPSSFPLGTDPAQSWYDGYYPIAWTNTDYKMLYVNMGHEQMNYGADTATSSTFDSATQNQMFMNAFRWLGGAMR